MCCSESIVLFLVRAGIALFFPYQFIWNFRYISSVIPIGAMFAMTLWLGNSAYLYISVAFAQMLKAISMCATIYLDRDGKA
jgi:hypothetical protein